MFLRYFPALTVDYVLNGPDGNGMPLDWWEIGTAIIDVLRQRDLGGER